jgi:hypothetical protein
MDLKNTIIKQLSAPVKRKGTQEYMTDEDGNIVTSEAAIGMTIVQKALSGDLQAIAFCLNLQLQQQRDPKTEAEEADRRRQQTEQNRDEIRRTLETDNLWTDSLALDLDELAQQKTFIDRLTEQMNQPGYQDTFTIPPQGRHHDAHPQSLKRIPRQGRGEVPARHGAPPCRSHQAQAPGPAV